MRPVRPGIVLAALFVLGSCSKDSTSPNPVVAAIHVTPGIDSVGTLGRTVPFAAQAVDAGGSPVTATVVWRSSNPAVATVDSVTGLATAVTNGTTVISAHVGSVSGQATMAVAQVVAHVVISPPSAGFSAVGDTQRLTAVAKDSSGAIVQGVPFLWFSSDANVATVDTAGLVKSKGPGGGFITAAGRGVPGSAVITVTQTPMRLVFSTVPPSPIPVDRVFPTAMQVEVRDSNGQLVTGSRIPITLTIAPVVSSGTLNGTLTVNAVSGIATFTGLTMSGQAGVYHLAAGAPGLNTDTTGIFLVVAGTPASIVLDVPPSSVPGGAFPVFVQAFDTYGNLATENPDSIVLTGSSAFHGALDRREAGVLAGGAVTFDSVVVDGPGNFTIVATDGSLSGSAPTQSLMADLTSSVVTAAATACDLDVSGQAFCWGSGIYGQLGGGLTFSSTVPRLVARDLTFTKLATGFGHSCGIVTGGDLYCWGSNSIGQLGNGVPFGSLPETLPVLVVGGHKFTEVAVGYQHTCAVTVANEIYCWGDDSRGELGSGKTAPSGLTGTPTLVSGGLSWSHVTVSEGFFYTCALTTTGVPYCWGANEYAQLGDNSLVDDSVPVAVVGAVKAWTIAAGATHTCALALSDSTAYCWGTNGIGRSGIQTDSVAAQVDVADHLISLGSGGDQSCGQIGDHEVDCWSTLSAPGIDSRWGTPDTISVAGNFECRSISSIISCLGGNEDGELGDGTHTSQFATFVNVLLIPPAPPAPRKR